MRKEQDSHHLLPAHEAGGNGIRHVPKFAGLVVAERLRSDLGSVDQDVKGARAVLAAPVRADER